MKRLGPESFDVCVEMMLNANPWNQLYFTEEQCQTDLHNPQIMVDAAFNNESVLGFIATMAHGLETEPMIVYLCVHENHRSQGIGSALIAHFESTLFPDADNLYMFVSDINPDAIRLYERLGYARIGELPDFNLVGQTEYLYRKSRRPRQQRFAKID